MNGPVMYSKRRRMKGKKSATDLHGRKGTLTKKMKPKEKTRSTDCTDSHRLFHIMFCASLSVLCLCSSVAHLLSKRRFKQ